MNKLTADDKVILRFKELYRKDLEKYKTRLAVLTGLLLAGKKREYISDMFVSVDSEIKFLGIEIRRLESFFNRFADTYNIAKYFDNYFECFVKEELTLKQANEEIKKYPNKGLITYRIKEIKPN